MPERAARTVLFPEVAAGGFTAIDGTVQFYGRVQALLTPQTRLLDLGAGRGAALHDDPVPYRRALRDFRGRCAEVVGADPDPAVLTNPGLDRATVIAADGRLDLPDASVDIIVSDYVLEHIEDPAAFVAELSRVLAPGGWFCARTPNRRGYLALAARMVPNRLHWAVLSRVQPDRKTEDVFPTHFRLNTLAALRTILPAPQWRHASYAWTPEPAYCGTRVWAWRAAIALGWVLPRSMATTLMVFVQKARTDG